MKMATQIQKMREKAETLLVEAEESIADGDVTKAREMILDSQQLVADAQEAEDAASDIKRLKGEYNRPTNAVPIATEERETDALNEKRADGYGRDHVDSNFQPAGFVKGLPPAIQTNWVREKMGSNLKTEADFYSKTWERWFRDRTVKEAFSYLKNSGTQLYITLVFPVEFTALIALSSRRG